MALASVCGFQSNDYMKPCSFSLNNLMQSQCGNLENNLSLAVPPFENVRLYLQKGFIVLIISSLLLAS